MSKNSGHREFFLSQKSNRAQASLLSGTNTAPWPHILDPALFRLRGSMLGTPATASALLKFLRQLSLYPELSPLTKITAMSPTGKTQAVRTR